jgi:hypothetical protein
MTSRRAFALFAAISLATILASSANAATKTKRTRYYAPVASAAPSCPGSHLFHCGPIYNSTDYLGNDPDPFIRAMIQRDLGAKYGGEN